MAVNPDTSTALPVLRARMFGVPFLGEAVENLNAVGDADADDQRQRHDVCQIERDAEPAHQAGQPKRADADRQQRQNHRAEAAEMERAP